MNKVYKKNIDSKEKECIRFLNTFKRKEKIFTCFSGGKDSLVAIDLAIRSGIKNIVFCDTTIEFQDTIEYLDKIESFYNIEIHRISAPRPFFELANMIGFPSRTMRWCCKVYKFSPLAIFARQNHLTSYITGLRKEESQRRMKYEKISKDHLIKAKQINPILDWSEDEVWTYIKKYNLPTNPLYKLGFKRVGCWPCPFKTKEDWSLIKKFFPENYLLLKKKIKKIFTGCEGIGIKNLDDFIEKNKWASYSRPQNSELKGKIEVLPEMTMIHLENSNQLIKMKKIIPILSKDYEIIRNSIIVKKKLRRQSVKILVEKSLNCIGCGACTAICESLNIKDNSLHVNNNCNSCLRCLSTSLMKGACIMRNFSPFRLEVDTCQDPSFEPNFNGDSKYSKKRIGLIRTRSSLEKIVKMFENIADIKEFDKYIRIKNEKFIGNAYNSKGFVEIKFFPKNNKLEEVMNYYRKTMADIN